MYVLCYYVHFYNTFFLHFTNTYCKSSKFIWTLPQYTRWDVKICILMKYTKLIWILICMVTIKIHTDKVYVHIAPKFICVFLLQLTTSIQNLEMLLWKLVELLHHKNNVFGKTDRWMNRWTIWILLGFHMFMPSPFDVVNW